MCMYIYMCVQRVSMPCFSVCTSVLYSKRYDIFLEVDFTVNIKSVPLLFSLFSGYWVELNVLYDQGNVTRHRAVPRQYDSLKNH